MFQPYLTIEERIDKTLTYWQENSNVLQDEDNEFRKEIEDDIKKRKGLVYNLVSFYFWGEYFIRVTGYQIAILYAVLKMSKLY